jgi:hypothetical protein
VRGDRPRVQAGEHGDAAEHGLRGDADERGHREPGEVAAVRAQHGQQRGQHDRGQHEREHPVGELDRAVLRVLAVGTSESDVQFGQVGQPSPEPVSRTTPPVTTMPALATTDATASRRTSKSEARGSCTAPA